MKIVTNQIMELFFVPHLDITVPDKTLDGDEMLFFKREIRLFQLVKEPDRAETAPKISGNLLSAVCRVRIPSSANHQRRF